MRRLRRLPSNGIMDVATSNLPREGAFVLPNS
jgi:hypothetical protein